MSERNGSKWLRGVGLGVAICAAGMGAGACDSEAPTLRWGEPIATAAALSYVDAERTELLFVEPNAEGRLRTRSVAPFDEGTAVLWRRPTLDGDSLLVLTGPATLKDEDVGETLWRFPADGDGDPIGYSVGAPFTEVALTPDGTRAVLYFGDDLGASPLENANQVALVDLGGRSSRTFTLDGFGGRVTGVQFPGYGEGAGGLVDVDGTVRDLAAFVAQGEVVLVDMADPRANQVAVRLDTLGGFSPQTSLLRPADPAFTVPAVFLLSSGSPDIAMLTLSGKADPTQFTANISQLPVGLGATDLAVHNAGDLPYLIAAVPRDSVLEFVDIGTQEGFTIDVPGAPSQMFVRDGLAGRELVAYASGGRDIYALDLTRVNSSIGRTPRTLRLGGGIQTLVRLDNSRLLVDTSGPLYVIDLDEEQLTPLTASAPYDAESAVLEGDDLLLGTPGQAWFSSVDLNELNPRSTLLDHPIEQFFYLSQKKQAIAIHGDLAGLATVVQAKAPSRSTSRTTWGFLAEGTLDEVEDN